MEDISIYSTTTSSSQQEESREGTRKRLEKLKTDKRFDKVEPSIKNKIIDSAIETITKLGSQKKENIKSLLMASPLILIPFVGTMVFDAYTRDLPQTIKDTKELIYAKVEEDLEKLNKLDKDQQTRSIQGLATESNVSNVNPNMPTRSYGISLVGAGASSESKNEGATNITSLHNEIADRLKKGKMSFEPQKRR
jgi:hypothetical protein